VTKYHAQPTEVLGQKFDSRGEARRYVDLTLLLAAGEIAELERQIKYPLEVNGVKVADYVADFRYREGKRVVVEDFKGVRTPVYRLKKKLMKAIHGVDIRETSA
jgi:hypothetical protein